jgi:hypothetical protein
VPTPTAAITTIKITTTTAAAIAPFLRLILFVSNREDYEAGFFGIFIAFAPIIASFQRIAE